jgi:hypothetical protein
VKSWRSEKLADLKSWFLPAFRFCVTGFSALCFVDEAGWLPTPV